MKTVIKVDEITLQHTKDYDEIGVIESEDCVSYIPIFTLKNKLAKFCAPHIEAPIGDGQKILLIQSDSTEEKDIKLLQEKLNARLVEIGYKIQE